MRVFVNILSHNGSDEDVQMKTVMISIQANRLHTVHTTVHNCYLSEVVVVVCVVHGVVLGPHDRLEVSPLCDRQHDDEIVMNCDVM